MSSHAMPCHVIPLVQYTTFEPYTPYTTIYNHFPFIWIIFNKIHISFFYHLLFCQRRNLLLQSFFNTILICFRCALCPPSHPLGNQISIVIFRSATYVHYHHPCVCIYKTAFIRILFNISGDFVVVVVIIVCINATIWVCVCVFMYVWMFVVFFIFVQMVIFFWLPGQYGRSIGVDHKFDRISDSQKKNKEKNASHSVSPLFWNRYCYYQV